MPGKKSKKRKKRKSVVAAVLKKQSAEASAGYRVDIMRVEPEMNFFQLKDDTSRRIDVLLFEAGEHNKYADAGMLTHETTFFIHRNVGPNNKSFVCPAETIGLRCPICEYREKARANGTITNDQANALYPKRRQLLNIVDTRDRDKGVQIWDISWFLFGSLLADRVRNADDDEAFAEFAEFDGGSTLKLGVKTKSTGEGRPWQEVISIDFKPRDAMDPAETLEATYCLDELIIVPDYDDLNKEFAGSFDDEEPDDGPTAEDLEAAEATGDGEPEDGNGEPEDAEIEDGRRVSVEIDGTAYEGVVSDLDAEEETCTVTFDDGDVSDDVAFDDCTLLEEEAGDGDAEPEEAGDGDAGDGEPEEAGIEDGSRVSVEIDGTAYEGEVSDVDAEEETCTVTFDDGDVSDDVAFGDCTLLEEEAGDGDAEPEPPKKKKGKATGKKSSSKTGGGKSSSAQPTSKKSSKGASKAAVKPGTCPGGGNFGTDCDKLNECFDCPNWNDCDTKSEEVGAAKSSKKKSKKSSKKSSKKKSK